MLVARSSEKLKATRDRLGGGESVAQFVADAADEAATGRSRLGDGGHVWRHRRLARQRRLGGIRKAARDPDRDGVRRSPAHERRGCVARYEAFASSP